MLESMYKNTAIAGITCAVPTEVKNHTDFFEVFGEKYVKKNVKMTGVEEFRIAKIEQTASDLCFIAARDVLDKLSWNPGEVGVLVFVTQFPDYREPSTAFVLQHRLGLGKSCIAFDVNLGCSGYVAGLQIVASLLQGSNKKKGLLLCGETPSKQLDLNDKSTALLFGDAGSATAIELDASETALSVFQMSDGSGFSSIYTPNEGFRYYCNNPHWKAAIDPSEPFVAVSAPVMNGDEVFQFTVRDVTACFQEFFNISGTTVDDFDFVVFHQAQKFIIDTIASLLDIPDEKILVSLKDFGNTSSPSIPLTLCVNKQAFPDKKSRVLLSGFGVGLSCGIADIQIDPHLLNPLISSDEYMEAC